ncbi:hypothetical protein Barb7_01655 [Bacteroidales bacterium Barb7]|nr:hypothetical protein Barb7_01655 [Bacteroidales bacterium Barb7]
MNAAMDVCIYVIISVYDFLHHGTRFLCRRCIVKVN